MKRVGLRERYGKCSIHAKGFQENVAVNNVQSATFRGKPSHLFFPTFSSCFFGKLRFNTAFPLQYRPLLPSIGFHLRPVGASRDAIILIQSCN